MKSIYNNNKLCPHISFIDVPLGFSSGKHKELMFTQIHDFINGNEDNDDPSFEKKIANSNFLQFCSKWKR
jgi:hypothetical protein